MSTMNNEQETLKIPLDSAWRRQTGNRASNRGHHSPPCLSSHSQRPQEMKTKPASRVPQPPRDPAPGPLNLVTSANRGPEHQEGLWGMKAADAGGGLQEQAQRGQAQAPPAAAAELSMDMLGDASHCPGLQHLTCRA